MNYKNTNAARTTITRNVKDIQGQENDNLFQAIVVMSRRSNQINKDMKEELHSKLDEFATHQDNLEEIFENKEQIEISKFYERLPKPHSIALQELVDGKVYHRNPNDENDAEIEA